MVTQAWGIVSGGLYTNANGLIHKLRELKVILDEKDVDIVCVTENHYHDELLEATMLLGGTEILSLIDQSAMLMNVVTLVAQLFMLSTQSKSWKTLTHLFNKSYHRYKCW